MNKLLLLILTLCWFSFSSALAADVKLMEKEELQGLLGTKDLVILDVRAGMDWSTSELKIKGALRADAADFNTWAEKYPKNGKLVLYCA
jgi:rhodanese-related sulfurtransferase